MTAVLQNSSVLTKGSFFFTKHTGHVLLIRKTCGLFTILVFTHRTCKSIPWCDIKNFSKNYTFSNIFSIFVKKLIKMPRSSKLKGLVIYNKTPVFHFLVNFPFHFLPIVFFHISLHLLEADAQGHSLLWNISHTIIPPAFHGSDTKLS